MSDKKYCKDFVALDRMLPFADVTIPPCTTGRLAAQLMRQALECGGHTKEIGFSADGHIHLEMSFPKPEQSKQFCEEGNATINRWMAATTSTSPLSQSNPDWKANLSSTLQVYREMQEKLQPLLRYLDGVPEADAIDALEKAYLLSPELEETVLVLGKMVKAYLAAQEPAQISPEYFGCQK